MKKGQTALAEKLEKLGFSAADILKIVPLMREWAINDIIQVDEYLTLTGEPFDTVNKQYDISNYMKKQMRERVKSQTKLEGSVLPTLSPK